MAISPEQLAEVTGLSPEEAKISWFAWGDYENKTGFWAPDVGVKIHEIESGQKVDTPVTEISLPPEPQSTADWLIRRVAS